MNKKRCILLMLSKLKIRKLLMNKYRVHNLYVIFAQFLKICKQVAGNLVNEAGKYTSERSHFQTFRPEGCCIEYGFENYRY